MNNKGFVLIETIVTSVFVLGLFTFIVANIIPLIGDYEKASDYDTVESVYDAHMIRKMLLKSDSGKLANLLSFTNVPNKFYFFDGTEICSYVTNSVYCKKLLSRDYLDVRELVLTTYTISDDFVSYARKNFDRALREYIIQMQRYTNTETNPSNYNFARRLIVVFNDGRITNIELLFDGEGGSGGATC